MNISKIFEELKLNNFRHAYNFFKLLYNILVIFPPLNPKSRNILKNLWYEKVIPIKEFYNKKNAIYTPIIKINNKLSYIFKKYSNNNYSGLNNIDNNSDIYDDNEDKTEEEKKNRELLENWTKSFEKCVTVNYHNQLKSPTFIYENELEDINIVYKNNKIQYCSIDLFLKKLCEDNSFNIEIYVNQDNNQTFNLINAFIYQSFGFIKYEILISKILEMHKYYKSHNKLTRVKNNRIIKLIFKLMKYLYDHKIYNCTYFQFSDELESKIKNFLKTNDLKEQNANLIDYKKGKQMIENDAINNNNNPQEKKLYPACSFINYPHSEFKFNILKYKERDIALILTYISIKNFNNLFNHLYELNPTIKKNENDKKHLMTLINFSNKLTNFLIEESLSYDLVETRVSIVEKIINVLIELRNLKNFNDLFSVYSALISISVVLNKTWKMITEKMKSNFKEIMDLCSASECYKNIKEEEIKYLKNNEFYVPCINITSKHIGFYDERTKYEGHNGLICIEKIIVNQKEIELFRNELRHLRTSNKIKLPKDNDINELKTVFYNINPKNYEELRKLSEKIEPEFILYKEPDKKKRETKTDLYINSNEFLNNVK